MKNSNFVYFDVGGVLLLDFTGTDKWTKFKRDLGITEKLDAEFDLLWEEHKPRVCIDLDIDLILPEIEKIIGSELSSDFSLLEDFVDRHEKNMSIWSVATNVAKKYKVGLLTNMHPRMLPMIKEKQLIPNIEWDVVIDSSVVGFQKPDEGIYQVAESRINPIQPEEIFFIDNRVWNIEAANKRGWRTFLYNPLDPEKSSHELSSLLI